MEKKKPHGTFAKLMSSPPPLPPQPETPVNRDVREAEPPRVAEKPAANSQDQKKLLGARITPQQYALFKKLYLQLNSDNVDSTIDKGEIVGLAIETLAELLDGTPDDFPNVSMIKRYLVNKLTKIPKS